MCQHIPDSCVCVCVSRCIRVCLADLGRPAPSGVRRGADVSHSACQQD